MAWLPQIKLAVVSNSRRSVQNLSYVKQPSLQLKLWLSPLFRMQSSSVSGGKVSPLRGPLSGRCGSLCYHERVMSLSPAFRPCCNELVHRKENEIRHRSFHTSQPRRALPPAVWMIVRPIIYGVSLLFGRTFRVWWSKLPEEKREKYIKAIKTNKFRILGVFGVLAFGIFLFYITHLEVEPITKRRRFNLFSHSDMRRLSEAVTEMIIEENIHRMLHHSHKYCRQAARVMQQIMSANYEMIANAGVRSFTIYVIDDPTVKNAQVCQNGAVFIYTGIFEVCSNDSQLGAVLAHEVAHTLINHQGEVFTRENIQGVITGLIIALLWATLPDLAALVAQFFAIDIARTILYLPFSRQTETEADAVGLQIAARTCFDVREMSAFWAKMAVFQEMGLESKHNEIWLTHPAHETRQKNLDMLIPDAIKLRESYKCPSLSRMDPRDMVEAWGKHIKAQIEKPPQPIGTKITLA